MLMTKISSILWGVRQRISGYMFSTLSSAFSNLSLLRDFTKDIVISKYLKYYWSNFWIEFKILKLNFK